MISSPTGCKKSVLMKLSSQSHYNYLWKRKKEPTEPTPVVKEHEHRLIGDTWSTLKQKYEVQGHMDLGLSRDIPVVAKLEGRHDIIAFPITLD